VYVKKIGKKSTEYGLADQQSNNKEVNTKTQVSGLVDSEGNYLIGSLGNDNRISNTRKTVRIGIAMSAETGGQVDIENLPSKKTGPVWNLKGRSIDDILTDLEILKNDPIYQCQ
jgi:hypothetical protein